MVQDTLGSTVRLVFQDELLLEIADGVLTDELLDVGCELLACLFLLVSNRSNVLSRSC